MSNYINANCTAIANDLIGQGLSIIPVNGKTPTVKWTEFQFRTPNQNELEYDEGIALVCGEVSGGAECIDVDVKNDPSGTLFDRLTTAIFLDNSNLSLQDVVIEKTPSGGWHIVYKCPTIDGNQVLAKSNDQKPLIETRGRGGYFVMAPSPGYELKNGEFKNIPTITPDQRESLLTACRSLNEYFEEVKPPQQKEWVSTSTGLTPWSDYNASADVPSLLEKNGWTYQKTVGGNQHYCRPDKAKGTSATWSEEKRLFHVFTTSTMLEAGKSYSPTALLAHFEHKSDFRETAKALNSQGYGEPSLQWSAPSTTEIKLAQVEIPPREKVQMTNKYKKKNTKPAIILQGSTLINFGEIFTLVGLPGQGKSAVCEAIACSYLNARMINGDNDKRFYVEKTFGFRFNTNDSCKKVLFIDTERTPDDVCDSHKNILRRSGSLVLGADGEIDGLVHLAVSEVGKINELKTLLERELATSEFELVILDGILDFSKSMNDEEDATEVVKWIRSLAVKYNVAVVVTIHPNKGTENIAGHLGGFLYRYCKAILFIRTVKGDKSTKEITCDPDMAKLSHADKGMLEPVYIKWDSEERLLMEVNYSPTEQRGKADKMERAFNCLLSDGEKMKHKDLMNNLTVRGYCKSDSNARVWIEDAKKTGIIHNGGGLYSLKLAS